MLHCSSLQAFIFTTAPATHSRQHYRSLSQRQRKHPIHYIGRREFFPIHSNNVAFPARKYNICEHTRWHFETILLSTTATVYASAHHGIAQRIMVVRPVSTEKVTQYQKRELDIAAQIRPPTPSIHVTRIWGTSILVALLALLQAGVRRTLTIVHERLSTRTSYEQSILERAERPLLLTAVVVVGTSISEAALESLGVTHALRLIPVFRELSLIVAIAWFLLSWMERLRIRIPIEKRAQADAIARLSAAATYIGATLLAINAAGVNVQAVVAFGGIGGITLGFAGRDIISNFFGGLMIYVTQPFSVGDWVRAVEEPALDGTVEHVGWYRTRVLTWDKRPLYIPNARFTTLIMENASRMSNRRIQHLLNIRLEDIPALQAIVSDIVEMLDTHPELDTRQHRLAFVDGFSDYSAQIWLSCYTKSVFAYDFRRVQQEILLGAHSIIRAHGARPASITTRDVRPGIDVDRYGALGGLGAMGDVKSDEECVADMSSATQKEEGVQETQNGVHADRSVPQGAVDQQIALATARSQVDKDSSTMKISGSPKGQSSQAPEGKSSTSSDMAQNSIVQDYWDG